jgi:hypothetical protein
MIFPKVIKGGQGNVTKSSRLIFSDIFEALDYPMRFPPRTQTEKITRHPPVGGCE